MDNSLAMAEFPDDAGDPLSPPIDADAAAPLEFADAPSADDEPALLADEDFIPDTPLRPPGPGIPESILWVIGLVMLQVVGAMLGMFLALAGEIAEGDPGQLLRSLQYQDGQEQFARNLMENSTVSLFWGVQSVFLLAALAAAALRLGRRRSQFLPMKAVPVPHAVVIGLLIFPLMIFGQSLFQFALEYWEWFLSYFPHFEGLSEQSSMDQIADIVPKTSLLVLMFLIAFVPAVGEELVFRGVIGRGLVARWGLPAGVLMTSLLFAAVHVHPVHALALMPLAICIHLAYVSTRSFWAPMAIHFINNGCAVLALKFMPGDPGVIQQTESAEPSLLVYVAAGLCILMLAALLWKMRVRFVLPDGTEWDPGYEGADVPPPHLNARKQFDRPGLRLVVATAASGLFLVSAAYFTYAAA